jgi:hypothetical protein
VSFVRTPIRHDGQLLEVGWPIIRPSHLVTALMQLAPALLRVPDGYWSNFVKDFPNHPVSQLQTVEALPLALHADEGSGASQARSKTNCAHVLVKHATQLSVTLLTLRGKSNDYQLVDGCDHWPKIAFSHHCGSSCGL